MRATSAAFRYATSLGETAFKTGIKCSPILDVDFEDFLNCYAEHADSIQLLKNWQASWIKASLV